MKTITYLCDYGMRDYNRYDGWKMKWDDSTETAVITKAGKGSKVLGGKDIMNLVLDSGERIVPDYHVIVVKDVHDED